MYNVNYNLLDSTLYFKPKPKFTTYIFSISYRFKLRKSFYIA